MKIKKIIISILTVLPLLTCIIALPFLPNKVPLHFDVNMQVDKWGSKYELLLISIIAILTVPLMKFASKRATRQENGGNNNEKVVSISTIALLVVLNVLNGLSIFLAVKSAGEAPLNVGYLLNIIMGVLGLVFIILGNFMPKTKPNTVVGMRFLWLKNNLTAWKKTQRFSGILSIILGFILIILSIFTKGKLCAILSLGVILAFIIIITVYSIVISKKYKKADL